VAKDALRPSHLRERALAYPDTEEAFPWGERVIKVKKKVFAFLGDVTQRDVVHLTVKLPTSGAAVLKRPYASPTGYGLGKSGWVSISGTKAKEKGLTIDRDEAFAWLDESFRAVAPKTTVAKLDATSTKQAPKKQAPKKQAKAPKAK
jgi:predicted DNA-binding protein (MmcQ/YjbR family)